MKWRAKWIQADWIREEKPARGAGRVWLTVLLAASWCYGLAAAIHRAWYERGPGKRTRLPCRVVSVGNLGVGGSGKTPTTAWIAVGLRARGHRVAIASRGYGGSVGDDVHVVSDGRHVHGRFEASGDEPMWLAARAPGVPVVVGRNRDRVGWHAVAAFDTHVLVLDDGFQHHRLQRDVDLVTFHGGAGLGNGQILPRGPLRERVSALSRADAVIVVDGPLPEEDAQRIKGAAAGVPWFAVARPVRCVRPLEGGPTAPAETLSGRRVGLLTAIARPAALRSSVEAHGATIVAERTFPDHHAFERADVAGLECDAGLWVTTEKDAGKIPPAWVSAADVRVLVLDTEVTDGDAFLDWLERQLRARAQGRDTTLPPPPRSDRD